ncbi:hypothetical protein OQJ26_05405 [Legionella sp. PATHC038]|uniref:hypothetical protein n=1 Tax=Legionella sheltonii TaxID=2992041 RepID=UPI0022439B29|nr:hypothetical protein [Legionella sp. PATHC038]MCW8398225.1 hypothetical protein [Legionella sp. PATHC038]
MDLSVPFYNVKLFYGDKIHAKYSLKNDQVMICKDKSGFSYSNIYWYYKGSQYFASLPVVLKNNERVSGKWADPEGTAIISSNNTYDSVAITCEYQQIPQSKYPS